MSPEAALSHAAVGHGLSGLLTKLGRNESLSPQEHAQSYLGAAEKGYGQLLKHSKSVLGSEPVDPPEVKPRKALEAHLEQIKANPESMLDVGGSMGEALPEHGALLAARAAQATNYLESIRPTPMQGAPLDKVAKISPAAQQKFNRQLDIAESPMIALKYLKSGTLQQQDLITLGTLYPGLLKSMTSRMMERMVDGKSKKSIPYHQRRSLGLLLGQSLDSTMTPQAAAAIMQANAGSSKQESQPQKGGPKKASGAELKETSKAAKLYGTHAQDKELGK